MRSFTLRITCLVVAIVLTIGGLAQQDDIQRHFEAGQKYQAGGEITLAESEFRQALGLALEQLGALSTDQQKYDQALKAYSEAAEARTNSDDALIGQGIVHLLRRNAETGIEVAQKVLARSPSNSRAHHLLAKLYMLAGRFKEAVNELEDVVSKNPSDLGAAYTLALVYLEDKRLEPAQKILNGLLNTLGDSPELRILIGRAYKEMRFLDQAIDEFQKAIALNPKVRRARFYLGQAYLIREGTAKIPTAIELFKQELAINPNDFHTHFLLGVAYRETRDFVRAAETLEQAVRANPQSADAFHFLGSALFGSGQYPKAVAALTKAIELTTDLSRNDYQVANTHYILSSAYRKLGKEEAAKKELQLSSELKSKSAVSSVDSLDAFLKSDSNVPESALSMEGKDTKGSVTLEIDLPSRINPTQAAPFESDLKQGIATIYSSIGLLRAAQSDYPHAASLFSRALEWKEDLKDLRYNAALTFYMMKTYDRAIPLLEKQLAFNPEKLQMRHLMALSYFYVGDFQKAEPLLRSVLREKTQDPELNLALAVSLLRTGSSPESEKVLRALIQQNPTQAALRLLLGQALAQQGAYSAAATEFQVALQLNPSMPEASYNLGMAHLRGGEFEKAEGAFRQELRIRPSDAKSHYHLGYLLLMKHQQEDAIGEMKRAIQLEPAYAEAHYQLGKTYLQQGKLDEARQRLEAACQIDPEKDYVHYQLAQAYLRLGRESEAQREMEKYRTLKAQHRSSSVPEGTIPPR
ncbi:MAG TPA: tetratricopeptide repeat protein [Acidobacteriota bacterium]|nr:tetratricopeptide repeat protein [Acidobacteriota bacterium]